MCPPGFYLVWGFVDKVDTHIPACTYIQTAFSLIHPEELVWSGEIQSMLLPESSCACMPSFRPVAQIFSLSFCYKSTIFGSFFNVERGVTMTYSKCSLVDIDPNI